MKTSLDNKKLAAMPFGSEMFLSQLLVQTHF